MVHLSLLHLFRMLSLILQHQCVPVHLLQPKKYNCPIISSWTSPSLWNRSPLVAEIRYTFVHDSLLQGINSRPRIYQRRERE